MPSEGGVKNSLLVRKKTFRKQEFIFKLKKNPRILEIIQHAHKSHRNVSMKKTEEPWIL